MSAYNKLQFPDYKADKKLCRDFLERFEGSAEEDDSSRKFPYMQQLQAIVNHQSSVLQLHLDDVAAFTTGSDFLSRVEQNTLRYQQLFYRAADRLLRELQPTAQLQLDSHDIWMQHRETRFKEARQREIDQAGGQPVDRDADSEDEEQPPAAGGAVGAGGSSVKTRFPVELTRRYELQIVPTSFHKLSAMRAVRGDAVGSLVSLRGIVTRVTDVAPLVRVVTYVCTTCGWESYQEVNDRSFTPLTACPSSVCVGQPGLARKGHLVQQTRGSRFVKYQAVKLQELPSEVPVGSIPRSLNLRLYGQLCRTVKPGDEVRLSGIFLPTPYTGYRAIRAGLTADVYLEVSHLVPAKRAYSELELSEELIAEIEERANGSDDVYEQLSSSIAPEIFGHSDVKKALLLLLVSGVSKELEDGVKLRGDINVLLMGDPGVAKSQLLKHIAHIAPRGVYTTGKGSSGVGLTAAVIRDPVTGDMSLEGGSLVLADRGVCCIDEFDKVRQSDAKADTANSQMEEGDRTAIHEVMEQQTVSIAKAGITTTLNARTAVVAAANPVYGRWDKRKSLEANLGLPTSLLSRFDLAFIILDRPQQDSDLSLAQHVTHVHMHSSPPVSSQSPPLSSSFLRAYIAYARSFSPFVPRELVDEVVGHYVSLRQEDDHHNSGAGSGGQHNNRQRFVTPRSLLSILRLAQAHARCRLKPAVDADDIAEAIRLLYVSRRSEDEDEDEGGSSSLQGGASGSRRGARRDVDGEIFRMIKQRRLETRSNRLSRAELERLALSRGYRLEDFNACLDSYERLNVWIVQSSGNIVFIQGSEQFGDGSRRRGRQDRGEDGEGDEDGDDDEEMRED